MNEALNNSGPSGSFILRCLFALLLSMTLTETGLAGTGAVFFATNSASGTNEIVMYGRAEDGTLTLHGRFSTGGVGSGPDGLIRSDPLGSQGSLAVDEGNRFLFAVNAGSDSVSVFGITKTGLTYVDSYQTGGTFPVSLTVRNNVLYVLNAANQSSFQGFRVDPGTGQLAPLPYGRCDLLIPLNLPKTEVFANPSQIGFTPDGNKLVVIRKQGPLAIDLLPPILGGHEEPRPTKGPGRIDVYALNNDGAPQNCSSPAISILREDPAKGSMPFAFTFSDNGYLLVAEVLGNFMEPNYPLGTSAISSYRIESDGNLELRSGSVPNFESAMCWVARSGKYVYAVNQASNAISKYKVNPIGNLKLVNAREVEIADGGLADLAITVDGRYLYQLAPGAHGTPPLGPGKIHAYKINDGNGDLTPIGTVDIPGDALTGQAGMAIVEFDADN